MCLSRWHAGVSAAQGSCHATLLTLECAGTMPAAGWMSSSGLPPDAASSASLASYEALSSAYANGSASPLMSCTANLPRTPSCTCGLAAAATMMTQALS